MKKTTKPSREEAIAAVKTLIGYIGENSDRAGLLKTPERVIKAWEHDWGLGYNKKFIARETASILAGQFEDGAENCNEMICVRAVPFFSHCEHHLAIFSGLAWVAYLPSRKILGLSKLARVVNLFSRRLQVQERLTTEVADFIDHHCKPLGVGVITKASHTCISSRGVHAPGVDAVTSALRGEFLTDAAVKDEFLRIVEMKR